MKKMTDNTSLGKLTWLFNIFVLIFFILTMVFLMKFDRTNVQVVADRPIYEKSLEKVEMIKHPMKQNKAEVDYYRHKLDTLKLREATTKSERKLKDEQIEVTTRTLKDKTDVLTKAKEDLIKAQAEFTPLKFAWDELNAKNNTAKSKVIVFAVITFVLFLVKLFVFATWNYRNSKNLHAALFWMKDGMAPWWSYVSWLIPVYNLFKPFSFIREIWTETDYALEEKSIVTVQKDRNIDNSGLYMGIWWTLFLCSLWLMNVVLFRTFFSEGPLFLKTNHSAMAIIAIVIMTLCMLIETYLVYCYNRKNLILIENADKFGTENTH